MSLPKIDEWIQEVEARPGSAVTILKLIARRLHDLTERNEELLSENIALQDGSRVEEYKRRIVHLEFQLDLLKRRFGMDQQALDALTAEPVPTPVDILLYSARGRILRIQPPAGTGPLGRLTGEVSVGGEPPKLLAVRASEEMLLLFSSGRVRTFAVEDIPLMPVGGSWAWEGGMLPDEPHAGERLSCLMPLSQLPLADYFLQTSRRGCLKKTMTAIAETVLNNHYLGKGGVEKTDQPLDLILCQKGEQFAMVSREGRLFGLNVEDLSYSVEERAKLDPTDHIIAGFTYKEEQLIFCLTQTGKVISKSTGFIEPMKAAVSRGQALIPSSRLEGGVRFIGAAAVGESDRLALLDEDGNLGLHGQPELTEAGSVQTECPLVAFGILPQAKVREKEMKQP
jgi:hypothetical protein